nr:Ferredoxin-dependent glutamate synthase [Ipomoea batatas]
MGAESVTDSWFSNFWRTSRKSSASEPEKSTIGILAFEVATLMSKVINLWQLVGDRQIARLREEITTSLGIQKLVSEDDDYLMDLALAEIINNVRCVAKSVVRLGKRCTDPTYQNLEKLFDDPVEMDLNGCGWEYKLKKMERKVKKMERFVASTMQLTQELEVLAEHEQTLRRLQAGANSGHVKLIEFQHKVVWQRQEVKNLREMSPWVRTHDYIVRLLLRSIFTITVRIKYAFGINQIGDTEESTNSEDFSTDSLVRSRSISAILQSSIYPSESNMSRLYLGPLGRSFSSLGLSSDKSKSSNRKLLTRQPSVLCGKPSQMRSRRLAPIASFGGCIKAGNDSPVIESCMPTNGDVLKPNDCYQRYTDDSKDTNGLALCGGIASAKVSFFNLKHKLLVAPPSTLGYAALALHYANIIILIEKLAASPHLISVDARDDLYGMLPSSVRNLLRAKLRLFTKTLASSVYNPSLASEWALALGRILEWLSPVAHNTVRWHSERNFEKQTTISGSNVLLVQTLYFANQAKTEAAIVELLMGLNYLSRFGEEIYNKNTVESSCSRACDDYFLHKGISQSAVNIGP